MSNTQPILEADSKSLRKYASELHGPMPLLHDANGVLQKGTGMLIGLILTTNALESRGIKAYTFMTQTVTCVDPRVVPESFLGYKIPDEKPLGEFCSAGWPTEAEY
jgi:hypothetical protein